MGNSSGTMHSAAKSSRNPSIANSQFSHHSHHHHPGHYQNYHHPHYPHHHRPTYTSSMGRNESGVSSHRLSATPTTTYDHSQAVYHSYPHLSNMYCHLYTNERRQNQFE